MDPTSPAFPNQAISRAPVAARPRGSISFRCLVPTLILWIALRASAAEVDPVSVPRYTHPGAGQVFYFVLTDRFANGSTANDTGGIAGGPDVSGFDPTRISHYHGGDLIGLTSKLDYIKQLGVTAIWITPPFKNKPMQDGTAGYHGYWILDFTKIDPHLGTEAEFRKFVQQAHARGLRVYLDIVANHTADVIKYRDGTTTYIDMATAPYRDASGKPFDPHLVAYNGLDSGSDFPRLAADRSFAHVPVVAPGEARSKGPDWLNDVTLYHNRGNSHFEGEDSMHGDFAGLDDLFTESPTVVRGFIEIYGRWIERFGIDGFRIDTVKHVNLEFWEAFAPAIRARARELGHPDFFQFGEVADHTGDTALVSEFSTTGNLDGTLDFGFYDGVREFVSKGHAASGLAELFENDAWYLGPACNAQSETTFTSNHDDGRFGLFLKEDNPKADDRLMCDLFLLGQELLFTVRGQPVIYYGDEQGMVGTGNDMGAREDMFPSQAPKFRNLPLLGTTRTGSDDKFDTGHPFYRTIRTLANLRMANPALSRGAMLIRGTSDPHVFAFSRIERSEKAEYLIALNNSRNDTITTKLATCQPAGSAFRCVFDSWDPHPADSPVLAVSEAGSVAVTLTPLQCVVWKAEAPLGMPASIPTIHFVTPDRASTLIFKQRVIVGQTITERQELRADVTGGDGFAEVTFVMERASRPNQYEVLGTADAAPYRVFWRPPADLVPGDELRFIATVDDLRGHRSAAAIDLMHVAPSALVFGIRGASVPVFNFEPDPHLTVAPGDDLSLTISASGTGPLDYEWLHDGTEMIGEFQPTLNLIHVSSKAAGHYRALVHNREGTVVSRDISVGVAP
jgi:glycosidase